MRICKTFTFLSIFIVLFYNCSLPADDEDEGNPEEDNTTSELPWEGETDKFTINSKEGVHLITMVTGLSGHDWNQKMNTPKKSK